MKNKYGLEEYDFPATVDLTTGETQNVKIACGFNNTDEGNAQRFLAHWHDDVRYCHESQTWFIWDTTRWALDANDEVYEFAKDVVRLIHAEAGFIEGDNKAETRALRKAVDKWAYASESNRAIKAMIELARTDSRITVRMHDFDANPWLINCPNGTLDLKERRLREHRREDLITKTSAVPYEPETESIEWYERLLEVLSFEQGAFLQRAAGSALTGINRDKALFVLFGKPNARKSTLLDPIFQTFGEYAMPVDISTFAKAITRPGGARSDIISLDGVRAAQCSEVPRGMTFNDAFVKAMTGANPRSARGLFERFMRKILPVTKFFIETNFLPRMSFDDDAAFNRFFIISFLNPIPLEDCNPKIKERLLTDEDAQKAIFAWLVQGCYDWQDYGLLPPDSVNAARKDYQRSMNPLLGFMETEVIEDPDANETTTELYKRFKLTSSAEERSDVPSITAFGEHLTALGFKQKHTNKGNFRMGIRLRGLGEYEDTDVDGIEITKTAKSEGCEECEGCLSFSFLNILAYMEGVQKCLHTLHRLHFLESDMNEFVDDIEHLK